jgi:hypothetical protein
MDDSIKHPVWFLVAGGPSLCGFDFDQLKDRNVIAINKSFYSLPAATVIYFSDGRVFNWHKNDMQKHPGRKITVARNVDDPCVEKWRNAGRSGLGIDGKDIKCGNNSGYAAINLAYHLDAKTIVLLGYDMKFDGDKSHHYGEYSIKNKEDTLTYKMLPWFETIKDPLKHEGVTVYNANHDSALDCFEKRDLLEFL